MDILSSSCRGIIAPEDVYMPEPSKHGSPDMRKPAFPLGYQVSGNVQTVGYEKLPKGLHKNSTCNSDRVEQAAFQSDLVLLISPHIRIRSLQYICTLHTHARDIFIFQGLNFTHLPQLVLQVQYVSNIDCESL